jgi:hypothetical protein
MMSSFRPDNAVEITSPRYGTGYRIGGRLVLTCTHLFDGYGGDHCKVRSKRTFGEVAAKVIWKAPDTIDIALVELPEAIEACPPIRFGTLPEAKSGEKVKFDFYGWPNWGFVVSEEGNDKATGLHIDGIIHVSDLSADGDSLVLEPERNPSTTQIENTRADESPWQGVSGAAVVCKGLVMGVLLRHYSPQRPESLEAKPLTKVYNNQEWCELLQKHGISPKPDSSIQDSAQIYIERFPIERNCYDNIVKPGMLIRIKAPEKMGKSLLLNKILAHAKQQNYQTVRLDFQSLEDEIMKNHSQFIRWLCKRVSKKIQLIDKVDENWQPESPSTFCTDYFGEYLLPSLNSPFVLALDNVDCFFEEKYQVVASNFFGMIRSWWGNAGATTDSEWQKLRLILVYSTEDLPKWKFQSPFNVGEAVKLSEFNGSQIQAFAQQYGLNLLPLQIENLTKLIGGHPYLLKMAFKHLKTNPNLTLDELLIKAATNEGIYYNHLQEYWLKLDDDPELATIFKAIINSDSPIQVNNHPKQLYKLESMGLISPEIKPRCQLYRVYFRNKLGQLL